MLLVPPRAKFIRDFLELLGLGATRIFEHRDCALHFARSAYFADAGPRYPELTNVIINYMQLMLNVWHSFRSKNSC